MAYLMDLRRRVVKAAGEGRRSRRRLAPSVLSGRRCGLGGTGQARAQGVGVKLTATELQTLRDELAAEPGLTLRHLQAWLCVPVANSTVCRMLQKLGMTRKRSR